MTLHLVEGATPFRRYSCLSYMTSCKKVLCELGVLKSRFRYMRGISVKREIHAGRGGSEGGTQAEELIKKSKKVEGGSLP